MLNRWHAEDREVILHQLGTDPARGLAPAESSRRLGEHGPNLLREPGRLSSGGQLARRLADALVLLPLAAAAICVYLGAWLEGLVLGAAAVCSGALGWNRERRGGRSLAALSRLGAPSARVVRGGKPFLIPAAELVTGDLAQLRAGDRVPADMRLFDAQRLCVDESSLTGEALPVVKDPARVLPAETALADRTNMVFAGTIVTAGGGTAVVTATGMRTELGRIAALLAQVGSEAPLLERRLSQVGRLLALGLLPAGAAALGALHAHGASSVALLHAAASLAAAAVPASLPAVVRAALALGVRRLARRQVIVRSLPGVDTLGAISVIGTDTTRTLTRNEMTVRELYLEGETLEVTGSGYAPEGAVLRGGRPAEPAEWETLGAALRIGALCSEARLEQVAGVWRAVGDPTEGALVALAAKAGLWRDDLTREHPVLRAFPHTAERQRTTVVVPGRGGRPTALMKGAVEVVLTHCFHQRTAAGVRPLSPADRERLLREAEVMAGRALRVCALAYREDAAGTESRAVERAMVWVGLVGMLDPPRPEAAAAIAACQAAGIDPVIICGDQKLTGLAVAREIGALREGDEAISGEELERLTPEALGACVERFRVYARVTAEDKLRIVRAWKGRGRLIAMTGDGVNDAPALEEADIGIAMGRGGAGVTREAAGLIVADDSFASIVGAAAEGRRVHGSITLVLSLLLASAAAGVLALLGAALAGTAAPLQTAQLLWVNLLVCPLPALGLVFESAAAGVARAARHSVRGGVVERGTVRSALLGGASVAATTLAAFFVVGRGTGGGIQARTAAFAVFALSLTLLSLRDGRWRNLLSLRGLRGNPWLPGGLLAAALLAVAAVQVDWLGGLLGTVPLARRDWLVVGVLAGAALPAAETLAAWLRARDDR